MAETKTSKRKRPVDEDNSKQRDRLSTIQKNSSKTVQTPINKFAVPISEIKKRKLENSFKGNASAGILVYIICTEWVSHIGVKK